MCAYVLLVSVGGGGVGMRAGVEGGGGGGGCSYIFTVY